MAAHAISEQKLACIQFIRTVIHGDDKAARIAKFREQMVKTAHAKRLALAHDVSLASERPRALGAGEMSEVPMFALRLGALVRQDELEFA